SQLKLSQCAVIIAIRPVEMTGAREVRFTRIGLQPRDGLQRLLRHSKAFRSMVGADSVKGIVGVHELDLSSKKGGITCERLVQQIDCPPQRLSLNRTEAYTESEVPGSTVKFKGGDICGRALLDRTFLSRRKLGL